MYSGIILAAGMGSRLSMVTTAPKSLLPVGGTSLLAGSIGRLRETGFAEIIVVVGYRDDLIREEVKAHGLASQVRFVVNPDYRNLGNGYSMLLGLEAALYSPVVFDADLHYETDILRRFLVDGCRDKLLVGPGAIEDTEATKILVDDESNIVKIADKQPAVETPESRFLGEALGIFLFSEDGRERIRRCARNFFRVEENRKLNWEYVLTDYMRTAKLHAHFDPSDRWIEIDSPEDYAEARRRFD